MQARARARASARACVFGSQTLMVQNIYLNHYVLKGFSIPLGQ